MRSIKNAMALCAGLILNSAVAFADAPQVGAPLPVLEIVDRGELTMRGDDFNFVIWSSKSNPNNVHVIQYFGANLKDRDVFQPFTDALQAQLDPGAVHVTTVLNMDAALWGTSGFVNSELKNNKKAHPESSIVLDEEGIGVSIWELGKNGTGLILTDKEGIVRFFKRASLDNEEIESTVKLIRTLNDG